MNDRIKKLIKPMIYVAMVIFVICCIIKKPQELRDYTSYLGYVIFGTLIIFILYEKFFWKFIPWNRPPILHKKYSGKLIYTYKDNSNTKPIDIYVKQSWLSVEISTKTDINSSFTVSGAIVKEHGNDVLYYTYITEPSAICQKNNPIQYGTCRMVLNNKNDNLKGKYWTSSQTVGDLEWSVIPRR